MEGKGICLTCHTIGKTGALRFPDLGGIGAQAKNRVPGLSDVEYLTQSLYEPFAFVVPGFPPAMPPVNVPPIGLNDQEILCVIAALQTLGGTPTVTLQTKHKYNSGAAAPGATPAAPATSTPGEPQPLTPKKGAQLQPGAFLHPMAAHHTSARPDRTPLAAARQGDQPPLTLRRSAIASAKAEGGVAR
jgi:hypothetical protein